MTETLQNPNLLLIVIGAAVFWQMVNSHSIALICGQKRWQALTFSVIISVSIVLLVANGQLFYACIGALVELAINLFLVELDEARDRHSKRENRTRLAQRFIGFINPVFLFAMSELYIRIAG